jgi:hypothetical protein
LCFVLFFFFFLFILLFLLLSVADVRRADLEREFALRSETPSSQQDLLSVLAMS